MSHGRDPAGDPGAAPIRGTGLLRDARFREHDTGPAHPERPSRLTAIDERLERSGLLAELDEVVPPLAALEELATLHPLEHVEAVRAACEAGPARLDADTAVSPASWGAARLAVGAAREACERVLDRRWANAFCAVRPPGHHAERARAMGFCLFNNVALAAQGLIEHHGLERVAILDWDVHHGNGTQHLFEERADVLYASLHQYPFYPGTGAARERGLGDGDGATLNRPMEAGTGDTPWLDALEEEVLPAIEAFRPQFVLLSAGFDAHRRDPLGGCDVTDEGFRRMTRAVLECAARTCEGRVVSLLEGGYDLEALASSVQVHLEELLSAGGR